MKVPELSRVPELPQAWLTVSVDFAILILTALAHIIPPFSLELDFLGRRIIVWESNERDILIEQAIMGLGRNLVLEKFSGIHKDDPG